jgi:hypothetical protein
MAPDCPTARDTICIHRENLATGAAAGQVPAPPGFGDRLQIHGASRGFSQRKINLSTPRGVDRLPNCDSYMTMLKNLARRPKKRLRLGAIRPNNRLPNTHVPVVVCRSAGIWTRGQSTALERPAAGGKPAHPAQRGTRLEATTDRAFLVSVGPPKADNRRGLSFLPGVRKGYFLSKRWL